MSGTEFFLWVVIVSSPTIIMIYEVWNLIVVSRDFARISREAKVEEGHSS